MQKPRGAKRPYENSNGHSSNYLNEARADEEAFEKLQLDPDDAKDEFDDMCGANNSLTSKLSLDDSTAEMMASSKRQRFFDDLSDDEDYQQMTDAERNERMAPRLNLDGHATDDDESDDEIITASVKNKRVIKARIFD